MNSIDATVGGLKTDLRYDMNPFHELSTTATDVAFTALSLQSTQTSSLQSSVSIAEPNSKDQEISAIAEEHNVVPQTMQRLLDNRVLEKKALTSLRQRYDNLCDPHSISGVGEIERVESAIKSAKQTIRSMEDEIVDLYCQGPKKCHEKQRPMCKAILNKRNVEKDNFRKLSDLEVRQALSDQTKRNKTSTALYNEVNLGNLVKRDPYPTGKLDLDSRWLSLTGDFLFKESSDLLDGKYPVHFCESIGDRMYMEDAHLATTITVHEKNYPLLAVFDGHSGAVVAKQLKEKLPSKLTQKLEELSGESAELTECCIYNALKLSLVEIDDEYLGAYGGSTAIVSIIVGNKVYTASVGDSRVIEIMPNPKPQYIPLSTDAVINAPNHPTDNKHREILERKGSRITASNGCYRVGRIGMGSAVGDPLQGQNCSVEISVAPLPEADGYLLLACDGFWHCWTPKSAALGVLNVIEESSNLQKAATSLAHSAYVNSYGEADNISVLLCKIPGRS